MSAAVVTASGGLLIAALVFVLNQRAQLRLERRQARLVRLNSQLRDLYGPLSALVDVNEQIWDALHHSFLPRSEQRRAGVAATDAEIERWSAWLGDALMPANRKMRDLIVQNSDLLLEDELPAPLLAFCAHVAAYEVFLGVESQTMGALSAHALISHPGVAYVTYIQESFRKLKVEQANLLRLTAPPAN